MGLIQIGFLIGAGVLALLIFWPSIKAKFWPTTSNAATTTLDTLSSGTTALANETAEAAAWLDLQGLMKWAALNGRQDLIAQLTPIAGEIWASTIPTTGPASTSTTNSALTVVANSIASLEKTLLNALTPTPSAPAGQIAPATTSTIPAASVSKP